MVVWVFWQPEKVTVVFPMRFRDSIDVVLATSFLQVCLYSEKL
jgi:actin related protein 2/3 complex subunit 2